MSDVDDYELPIGIVGPHPDEFYGAMGRVVCVCAVLEDKVTSLRHALARVEQGRFTHQPVSAQIQAIHTLAVDLPSPAADAVASYMSRVEAAVSTRNDYIHSLFPAQASGKLLGHRPMRDKAVLDGRAEIFETSVPEMREFIAEVSELVMAYNQVAALGAYLLPS